jgi:hypothetical protein
MRPADAAEEEAEREVEEEKPEYDFSEDYQRLAGLIILAFIVWVVIHWLFQNLPPPYPPLPAVR